MEYNLNTVSKIIKLGRFQYLLGDFLLFTMGALLAILLNAEFVLSKFVLGYAILFTAHLSVHYSNDYYDADVDQHTSPTVISGGSGILVENPELKEFAKWFSITYNEPINYSYSGFYSYIQLSHNIFLYSYYLETC